MRSRSILSVAALAVVSATLSACVMPGLAVSGTGAASAGLGPQAHARADLLHPLIVDWSGPQRAGLEAATRRGVLAVRYSGATLELLDGCRVPGRYGFVSLNPKVEELRVHDSSELWSALPLGAATLEGKLRQSGELGVLITIVGAYEWSLDGVRRSELGGDCATATHVIAGYDVGAFRLIAGASTELGAGAGAMGAGVGAQNERRRETLTQDGDPRRCERATNAGREAPDGCGAMVRLELVPVGASRTRRSLPVVTLGALSFTAPFVIERVSLGVKRPVPVDVILPRLPAQHARRAAVLQAGEQRLRAARDKARQTQKALENCRRTSCAEERALEVADGNAGSELDALAKVQATETLALAKLVTEGKKLESLEPGELALASHAGELPERLAALRAARERIPATQQLGWWVRYSLFQLDDSRANRELLATELRGTWRPEAARPMFVLLRQRLREGDREPAADLADELLTAHDPQDATKPLLTGELRKQALDEAIGANVHAGRWPRVMRLLVELHEMDRLAKVHGIWTQEELASRAIHLLGGPSTERLLDARAPTIGAFMLAAGLDLLDRDDWFEAIVALRQVLERAPSALEAPAALAALRAVYRRLGSAESVAAVDKLLTDYGIESPWAQRLFTSDVHPRYTRDELVASLTEPMDLALPPANEQQVKEDLAARLELLVVSCAKDLALAASAAGSRVDVAVRLTDGAPPQLSAKVTTPGKLGTEKTRFERCLMFGGSYFRTASAGLSAQVELTE